MKRLPIMRFPMNTAQKIIFNTIIVNGTKIVELGFSLVTIFFITRTLGTYNYGLYNTVLAFTMIFATLADLGISTVLLRDLSRPDTNESDLFASIFTLKTVVGALFLLVLTPLLGWLMPYAPIVKQGIIIISLSYFLLNVVNSLTVIFQKNLAMHTVAVVEFASRLTTLGLVWWFYATHQGVLAFLIAVLISSVVYVLLLLPLGGKIYPIRLKWDVSAWAMIMRDAIPIAIASVFMMLYFKFDTVLLSLMKPAEDVGIYSAAYKVLETMTYFPATIMILVMPTMARKLGQSAEEFKMIFQKVWDLVLMLAAPVAVGIFMIAGPIIHIIAGSAFSASIPSLRILSIAIGIIFLSNVLGYSVIVLNLQRKTIIVYVFAAILNVGLNLLFIPTYSYMATSVTTVVTEVFVNAFLLYFLYREAEITIPRRKFAKVLFASAVMAAVLWLFSGTETFLLIILGAVIYFAVLIPLGGIDRHDIKTLLERPNKNPSNQDIDSIINLGI